MMYQGLSKTSRLHLKEDFKNIICSGKRVQNKSLVLWYKPSPKARQDRRLGIVISKKLGCAVTRNRVKRLLREAFRLNRENLKSGIDYVFSPRNSEELATLSLMKEKILDVCQQAGLLP